MHHVGYPGIVFETAEKIRGLGYQDCNSGRKLLLQIIGGNRAVFLLYLNEGDAAAGKVRMQHLFGMGMKCCRVENRIRFLDAVHGDVRRLDSSGMPVIQGSVRNVQRRQLADERLEFKDRLEKALGELGLVRRIGRGKLGTGNDVLHHGGDEMIIDAAAEKRDHFGAVCFGKAGEDAGDLLFRTTGRHVQRLREQQVRRNIGEQLIDARDPDLLEHVRDILFRMGQIREHRLLLITRRRVLNFALYSKLLSWWCQ